MGETNKSYCLSCDSEVEYVVKEQIEKRIVKGLEINAVVKHAYCVNCGHQLFVYPIEKQNQIYIYDQYKIKKGLLTSQEIIAIREKYNLSQTKLAKIIKVGAKNIARYENGAIQDDSIDLLIRLFDKVPQLFGVITPGAKRTTTKIVSKYIDYTEIVDYSNDQYLYQNNNYYGGSMYGRTKIA